MPNIKTWVNFGVEVLGSVCLCFSCTTFAFPLFLIFWSVLAGGCCELSDFWGVLCLRDGFRVFQQSHRSWNTQFTEQLNYYGSSLKDPGCWWRFPSRGWEVTENKQQGNCVSTYATMKISHWIIVGEDQGLFCGLIRFAYSVFQNSKFGKLFILL